MFVNNLGSLWGIPAALMCAAAAIEYNASSPASIPDFVTQHAPLIYLYSEERYFPGSIEDYLHHVVMSTGSHNLTATLRPENLRYYEQRIQSLLPPSPETLEVFLTSKEQWEPEPGPDWLTLYKTNQPNLLTAKIEHAVATLVVVDKPEQGVIDAFWHFFYPFNLGAFVMGHGPLGNHLGDWEHSLVRFDRKTQKPMLVWMSAHGGGTAYEYDSLLEEGFYEGKRPTLFSARGTHAQYTSSGRHSHDIPWHMLSDFTDRGHLWDPVRNFVAYTFNGDEVRPANGSDPGREQQWGDWLLFSGLWGNKKLDKTDARQQWSPFEWRVIDGPTGPLYKNLMRKSPCERFKWWNFFHRCQVRGRITAGEGIEADASGCEAIVERFPVFLHPFAELAFKGGWLCFWVDRLFS